MHIKSAISLGVLLAVLGSTASANTTVNAATAPAAAPHTNVITVEDPGRVTNEQRDKLLTMVTPQAGRLLQSLISELNVSNEQAVGGAGALIGLARNQLTASESTQLEREFPGLQKLTHGKLLDEVGSLNVTTTRGEADNARGLPDQLSAQAEISGTERLGSMLDKVHQVNDVNQIFTALHMDQQKVEQFKPIILNHMRQQNVAPSLLNRITSIWGM